MFTRYAHQIRSLIQGTVSLEVDHAIDTLMGEEQWDVIGLVLLTASEISARRLVDRLLEAEVIDPLIPAACARREIRRPGVSGPAALGAGAIFRDFEADSDGPGVPDHIREEAEALTAQANQSRRIAAQKEAQRDRDAIRARIVDQLAERLNVSDDALNALAVIARVSVFEETRRAAAMKLATNKMVIGRLMREQRYEELTMIARSSDSRGVQARIAEAFAESLPEPTTPGYRDILELIGEYHPDDEKRMAARRALNSG
ncbi:MAG: hypothetical protein J7M38_04915 [Armatimonadetes bacterium]|nr:hypothetical protein [Armatimonadota bacterium]